VRTLSGDDRDALGCLKPREWVTVPRSSASAQSLAGSNLFRGARQGFSFTTKTTRLIGQEVSLGLQFDRAILRRGSRRLHCASGSLSNRQGPTDGAQASFRSRHPARERLGLCHLVTQKVVRTHAAPATLERGDLSVEPIQVRTQPLIFGCETLS
jgi:hypothetical protein